MKCGKVMRSMGILVLILSAVMLTACSKGTGQRVAAVESAAEPVTAGESDGEPDGEGQTSEASTVGALTAEAATTENVSAVPGQIFLYGEQHGVEQILDKEFELWSEQYHNGTMRHLFVELPYYTGEFLNMWMQSDSDEILDAVYDDWAGSAAHNPYIKTFYKKIKEECPQTVFHGTDVGHQYNTTGERFLKQLKENNLENTEQYQFAQKVIEQGKHYYDYSDDVYRENRMSENFIYEFDQLDGESIMGFYGAAHTGLEAMACGGAVPSMGNQLRQNYGDIIQSEDLTLILKATEPLKMDTINVDGKDYEACYFGEQDLTGFKNFASRKFWRLENAFDDFKDMAKTGDVLPYKEYPMQIVEGQIFVIDYTMSDGSSMRKYYCSDGRIWEGNPATEEITIE